MKKLIIFIIINCQLLIVNLYAEKYGWSNIGDRLPNTQSTVTISGISMVGDSMWILSGYGTYLNQVPGEIYFSSDRGKTFKIQTTKYGTHAIHMLDSKRGYCGRVRGCGRV